MMLAGSRARRFTLIGLGVLTVVVLIVVFFPWNLLRGPIASYASSRLHRPVAIGHLSVDLGWTTQVQVDDVTVGNAAWSQTQPMATFPSTVLTFRVPSLLRLSPDAVRLREPNILLERNEAGEPNWKFDGNSGGGDAEALLGVIDVDRGAVRFRDPTLRANIDATLQTNPATGSAPQTLQFGGRGTFRDEPFEIEGKSQGLAELSRIDSPYQLVLNARAGRTSVAFDGTVVPSQLQDLNGALKLKGPDLSQLYPIVPSPLPWTPPYELAANLSHANDQWIARDLEGTVGDSDLAGTFIVDLSSKRALTTADLTSRKFNYKDLGGFVGLPPGERTRAAQTAEQKRELQKRAQTNRGLPDKPFDLAKLRQYDVDLKFKGNSVKWGTIPIDHLDTHLVLKAGVLRFEPLEFGIADGRVISNITVDVTKPVPSAQAKIEARSIELKRLFPQLASPNGSAGRFGARAEFRAQGNSVADMLAAANGEAAVAMRRWRSQYAAARADEYRSCARCPTIDWRRRDGRHSLRRGRACMPRTA